MQHSKVALCLKIRYAAAARPDTNRLLLLLNRGMHACTPPAQADGARVDPSKPIEGPLLGKPEEPGPEDCCQACTRLQQTAHKAR